MKTLVWFRIAQTLMAPTEHCWYTISWKDYGDNGWWQLKVNDQWVQMAGDIESNKEYAQERYDYSLDAPK